VGSECSPGSLCPYSLAHVTQPLGASKKDHETLSPGRLQQVGAVMITGGVGGKTSSSPPQPSFLCPGHTGGAGTHLPGHLLVGHGETRDRGGGVEEVPGIHVVAIARLLHLPPGTQLGICLITGLLGC
jgi:hypothetical protein